MHRRASGGHFGVPTPWREAEGHTRGVAIARRRGTPRGQRPRACTEAPCTGTGRSRVCLRPGLAQTAPGSPRTHAGDGRTREVGPPHTTRETAEQGRGTGCGGGGGRGRGKGNLREQNTPRTQRRTGVPSALERVREAAKKDRKQRFTALSHHVYDVERLRAAYYALKRDAAAGVDGETWKQYGEDMEARLQDLADRLKRGAYSTRRWIPASAGGRAVPLRAAGAVCPLRAGAACRQDPPDRVRPLRAGELGTARSRQARDVQLPGLHA